MSVPLEPSSEPGSVTLAVVTFQRPQQLARLLPRLLTQAAGCRGRQVGVLVIDNDPQCSAREVVSSTEAGDVEVRYVHEEVPGIAAARNRALNEARTDLLVFIDDDEEPSSQWLDRLLRTHTTSGAAAVAGPVLPVYLRPPADWIAAGPFQRSPDFEDGARIGHAATGNLLVDLEQIHRIGARMPAIGTRGGEDVIFTDLIVRGGGHLVWSAEATVYEHVVPARASARWVLLRSMVDGNNESSRLLREHSHGSGKRRLQALCRGGARIAGGGFRAGLGTIRRDAALQGGGLHTTFRGLGMALGAVGVVYDTYARPGSRRWTLERLPSAHGGRGYARKRS